MRVSSAKFLVHMSDQTSSADDSASSGNQKKKRNFSGWVQRRFFPINDVKSSATLAYSMLEAITRNEGAPRHETFEDAIASQGLTEKDLLSAYRRQRLTAILLFVAMIAALLYVAFLMLTLTTLADFFVAIMAIAPASVLAIGSFRSAFRAWQIRTKRLGELKYFISNMREWWPVSIHSLDLAPTPKLTAAKKKKKPAKA